MICHIVRVFHAVYVHNAQRRADSINKQTVCSSEFSHARYCAFTLYLRAFEALTAHVRRTGSHGDSGAESAVRYVIY
jgi:hypothetical protein